MSRHLALRTRIRRELHYLVADALYYSGILALRQSIRRLLGHARETCVLGLHRVLTEEETLRTLSLAGMILREKTFGELLNYLKRNFQVVSLGEFLICRSDGAAYRRPACLLTFDDGWCDNFTTAFPYLEKVRMPAVVFLITGLIGTPEVFWVERLIQAWRASNRRREIQSELLSLGVPQNSVTDIVGIVEHLKQMPAAKRKQILSRVCLGEPTGQRRGNVDRMAAWEEIQTMHQEGVQFGAHTVTHPLLVYEEDSVVLEELRESKQTIETKLGVTVTAFAYPNGSWDERIRSLVKRAGYECAFTTQRGWHGHADDPYSVKRIMIHEGVVTGRDGRFSPAMFQLRLSGWF